MNDVDSRKTFKKQKISSENTREKEFLLTLAGVFGTNTNVMFKKNKSFLV